MQGRAWFGISAAGARGAGITPLQRANPTKQIPEKENPWVCVILVTWMRDPDSRHLLLLQACF